ncbi:MULTISPECIES: hypothetical protein [unclassified Paenibacillus]|uniref:hypothetical protein n=1 Tax=unclassified Paenibacillus TaxID=185978 RepID=UPI002F3E47CA
MSHLLLFDLLLAQSLAYLNRIGERMKAISLIFVMIPVLLIYDQKRGFAFRFDDEQKIDIHRRKPL